MKTFVLCLIISFLGWSQLAAQEAALSPTQRQDLEVAEREHNFMIKKLAEAEKEADAIKLAEMVAYCDGKLKKIDERLARAQPPENNPKVADFLKRLKQSRDTLATLSSKRAQADDASGATDRLRQDMERLSMLLKLCEANAQTLQSVDVAAALTKTLEDNRKFLDDCATRHAQKMKGSTPEGMELKTLFEETRRQFKFVGDVIHGLRESLPKGIDSKLQQAQAKAEEAVANNKPAFFEHGIAELLDSTLADIRMYSAIAEAKNADVEKIQSSFAEKLQSIHAMARKLNADNLEARTLPDDAYKGDDHETLLDMVRKDWAKAYPGDEILALRIPMMGWEQTNEWRWSDGTNSWYEIRYSTLQVMVVVKTDDTIASLYPVNITKDHLNGDKLELDSSAKRIGLLRQDILRSKLSN
ncbi:MAG: hypothetical protein AB7F75_07420 [Planctomycetota bacterium]